MAEPRYQSARDVAPRLQAHFAQLLETSSDALGGPAAATAPTIEEIEAIIDAAFWASLKREENYLPRISLALMPPTRSTRPLLFDMPLPLHPVSLVRVSPAVERPGIHLGVWNLGGELRVWGTTRVVPVTSLVLEVSAPGLLVVKHQRGSGGKFVNVAVLEADRVKMVDDRARAKPDCPHLLSTLLGVDSPSQWSAHPGVLVELAVSMRAHGRGGTMLVVPSGTNAWEESVIKPISYAVSPAFMALTDLVQRPLGERHTRAWQDEMDDTVEAVAGLTAVDGAALVTDRFELLAFGVKIARRKGSPLVEQAAMTEPIEGGETAIVHPSRLGGTRHLSAAQFVHDQRDGMALVASQDGRFTIFCWSHVEGIVHAHRVETLLL